MQYVRALAATTAVLLLTACGEGKKDKNDDSDSTSDAVAAPAADTLQLKGTGLLAQSLYNTLGPGKDLSDQQDMEGKPVSLFDLYGSNFGLTAGLRFGEIYPDSPSTAYLLSLAIVAENAARLCRDELYNRDLTLCRCDTEEDALAMLIRAIPFADYSTTEGQETVRQFKDRCSTDYVKAVSAVIASIAFAVKT